MYKLLIYLPVTAFLFFAGYLVSVFANAVYVDPDEIQTLFPELSERRRRQLQRLTSNPRAFIQVAFLVRISVAIFLGVLALLTARALMEMRLVPPIIIYIVIIPVFWSAGLVFLLSMPRRISPRQGKARVARFLPLINLIYLVSAPIISRLGKIAARRHGGEIAEDQKDDIVERAIESLAETSGITAPLIEEDEKEMIHQIFQLDVTEVEEIMIPRIDVIGIEAGATLDDIRALIRQHGYSRYPVFVGSIDNIVGLLKVKDLLVLDETEAQNFKLADHIREPLRVGEHRKIDQLLADFKRTRIHMAVVMDEFGGTAGIVTLEDILEEIVGEIEDEHNAAKDQDIVRLDNGSLEVSGACPLEDLAEALGVEMRQGEFETVGGMIYDMVGSVPVEGTFLTWENRKLRVVEVEGQRIKKVLVLPASPLSR